MINDLFFISMIARAFDKEDPMTALAETLKEIESTGVQPAFSCGLTQFYQLVKEVVLNTKFKILIQKNGEEFSTVSVGPAHALVFIDGILPGNYLIKLSTGRQLWSGVIKSEYVLLSKSPKPHLFQLAADTSDRSLEHSRKLIFLDGELVAYIIPGIEAGQIGIKLHGHTDEHTRDR